MKNILVFLLAVTIIAGFAGCSGKSSEVSDEDSGITGIYAPGQTVIAYDYTHGGYVGKAEIKYGVGRIAQFETESDQGNLDSCCAVFAEGLLEENRAGKADLRDAVTVEVEPDGNGPAV